MSRKKYLLFVLVFLLFTSLSFGIGYLVAKEANPAPIIIEKCSEVK